MDTFTLPKEIEMKLPYGKSIYATFEDELEELEKIEIPNGRKRRTKTKKPKYPISF